MPSDEGRDAYYRKRDMMKEQARAEDAAARSGPLIDRLEPLSPYVEKETQKILQGIGDYAGAGAIGLGTAALLGAPPIVAAGALGLGATSASMYVAEGLTDARQGRKKEGAEKIALGLLEAGTTRAMSAARPTVVLSKSTMGKFAQRAAPYAPGAAALGYDVGINAAQDALRDYAAKTQDAELSKELTRLADDPASLSSIASRQAGAKVELPEMEAVGRRGPLAFIGIGPRVYKFTGDPAVPAPKQK